MEHLDIEFRRIQECDLELLRQWRMQPDITKYMNTDPQITVEDQKTGITTLCSKRTSIIGLLLLIM